MGGGGAELQYSRDPYPQVGNSQVGEQLQPQKFSPRSEGSEYHVRLPSLGSCTRKMSPQNVWL